MVSPAWYSNIVAFKLPEEAKMVILDLPGRNTIRFSKDSMVGYYPEISQRNKITWSSHIAPGSNRIWATETAPPVVEIDVTLGTKLKVGEAEMGLAGAELESARLAEGKKWMNDKG